MARPGGIETSLLGAFDLGHLAVVHHDLHDAEAQVLDLLTDQGEPLGSLHE